MWSIGAAAILAGGGYLASRAARPANTQSGGGYAAAVSTVVASVGEIHATLRLNGTIAAQNAVTLLAPRIQGSRSDFNRGGDRGGGGGLDFNLVLLHLAKAGVYVKAGDVVAEFDPQNQLQRLDDYKDTVTQLEGSIQKMTADLASSMEVANQAVRTAKATWDKAVLDLQTAPIRSDLDVEKYKLSVEEAELSYKEQIKQVALLQESQQASIRSSQFNLGQSRSELQRAQNNVAKMTIHASIDGMVVMSNLVLNNEMRQIREGDQIFAGQPFMSIVDPRSMVLNATVNQVDAQRLRLGMKAALKLDAYQALDLPATLDGIGAMARASTFRANYVGEIPVRLKVAGTDPRLLPDLTGSAEVVLGTEQNAVVVPRSAVFSEDSGPVVYLRTPEGWERKPVELGLSSYTNVAIRSGVKQGDVLAASRVL